MFDQIPNLIKALIVIGVVLAGPVMVFSIIFGGAQAAAIVVLILFVYFSTIYIVGVRRYMRGK